MNNQFIEESKDRFLIEGEQQPPIQVQLQAFPQNQPQQQYQQYQQIPQYQPQLQPIYILQGNQQQQTQQNNNIVIDDSNFCSNMCCTLTWLIFAVIPTMANIFFLSGYFLYINIIFLIAAILIIISICFKNLTIYKVGYAFYVIYGCLNIIFYFIIVIVIWNYVDKLTYLGVSLDYLIGQMSQKDKDAIQQILMIYRISFTVSLIIEIVFLSAISNCLRKKILVFEAYNNYIRSLKNGLNQQPNSA